MTTSRRLPIVEPERSVFDSLELNDPVAVIAAVHQDLVVGLASAFQPAAHPDAPPVASFAALSGLTADELRDLGIEPGTFGPPGPGFQPVTDGDQASVAWVFDTINDGEDFFGLAPTRRPVRITGHTLLRNDNGEWQLHRTIDWLDAIGQMGVAVSGRTIPVVDGAV